MAESPRDTRSEFTPMTMGLSPSVATTTATTYTDMTYYRGVLMSYFIDATIGTCTVASNEVRLP